MSIVSLVGCFSHFSSSLLYLAVHYRRRSTSNCHSISSRSTPLRQVERLERVLEAASRLERQRVVQDCGVRADEQREVREEVEEV